MKDANSAVVDFFSNCKGYKTIGKMLKMIGVMVLAMLAVASIPVAGPIIIFGHTWDYRDQGWSKAYANKAHGIYIDANCPFKSPTCPSASTLDECFGVRKHFCAKNSYQRYITLRTCAMKILTRKCWKNFSASCHHTKQG